MSFADVRYTCYIYIYIISKKLSSPLQARPSWSSHLHSNPGAPAIGRGQPRRHGKPRPCERPPFEERGCGGGIHEASRAARQPQRVQLHPLAHFCRAGVCLGVCVDPHGCAT